MHFFARPSLLALATLLFACHSGLDVPNGAPDGGPPCSSITSQFECSARADCVADTCAECRCTPVFVACRAPSAAQTACPEFSCPTLDCCHNDSDCTEGATSCMVPPIGGGCGICNTEPPASTCQTDGDCTTPGTICDPVPCTCGTNVTMACTQGCKTDADCPEPQTCGTDSRCHPRPCDSSCAGNYDCESGVCSRKACTKDSDCGSPGYCVDQLCSHGLGECVSIPV